MYFFYSGLAEVAAAIGQGPQVAQGDQPVQVRLEKKKSSKEENILSAQLAGLHGSLISRSDGSETVQAPSSFGNCVSGSVAAPIGVVSDTGSKLPSTSTRASGDASEFDAAAANNVTSAPVVDLRKSDFQLVNCSPGISQNLPTAVSSGIGAFAHGNTSHSHNVAISPSNGRTKLGMNPSGQIYPVELHPNYTQQMVAQGGNTNSMAEGMSQNADFSYFRHTVGRNNSALDSTLAAAGTMIGNIARGLMEGATPVLNNLVALYKVDI